MQRRRPPPAAETGRSCWGRGQQDASDSEADAGSHNPALASASDDGEGKPISREPPRSDKLALWQSDAIAAPALLRQHPYPLRRSAPALPRGEPRSVRTPSFTQETGRFAQVLLIFPRRCDTFRVVRRSLFLPLIFTIQRW